MAILIGYASAHGSTRGIAERIAARLGRQGFETVTRAMDQVDDAASYDAFVLGSAVHNQAWLPAASAFVQRNTEALAARPVWLFSVSSVGDHGSFFSHLVARLFRKVRSESKEVAGYRKALHARDHHGFAGAIERSHWSLPGHLFLKALGGHYGDHRDWDEIDEWADDIARELRSTESVTESVTRRSPSCGDFGYGFGGGGTSDVVRGGGAQEAFRVAGELVFAAVGAEEEVSAAVVEVSGACGVGVQTAHGVAVVAGEADEHAGDCTGCGARVPMRTDEARPPSGASGGTDPGRGCGPVLRARAAGLGPRGAR